MYSRISITSSVFIDVDEEHSQHPAGNEMPKNEAANSFFSTEYMLQMKNDQRTVAISETAIFIKFH